MSRRVLGWCVRLYPAAWRRRYESELSALIEDLPSPGARAVWDIAKGALIMRLTLPSGGAVSLALAGAVLAFAASFAWTPQFGTQSTLRLQASGGRGVNDVAILESVARAQQQALSRRTLQETIERNNLYPQERASMPAEDVIERMQRNIGVSGVKRGHVTVSFRYPEPQAAQRVARELTVGLLDTYARGSAGLATLELVDLPALPQTPMFPNRVSAALTGLFAGGILGGLLALWRRRRPVA